MRFLDKVYVGTSGWHYLHWKGPFYPPHIKNEDLLRFYAEHFNSVEVNNSFYHLIDKKTFRSWKKVVGKGFLFSLKASRYITHIKRLKPEKVSFQKFFSRAEALGSTLGPILFQLPPRWKRDVERLRAFLKALPSGYRYTFEFRDPDWFHEETYDLLRKHEAAFCIFELAGLRSPKKVTADFVYVRLHGPGKKYQGSYSSEDLSSWAYESFEWKNKGKEVFFYFDNDEAGYAAQNALKFQEYVIENEKKKVEICKK